MAAGRAANPFWTYSLRLYKRPGVAPACLALQERLGLDVNVLLFCLWTASRGERLPARTVTLVAGLSQLWSAHVVRPLRHARRFLKPLSLPGLRRDVARVELAAERVEQDLLLRLAPRRPRAAPASAAAADVAADNLAAYLGRIRAAAQAADIRHIAAILEAAFPGGPVADLRRRLRSRLQAGRT